MFLRVKTWLTTKGLLVLHDDRRLTLIEGLLLLHDVLDDGTLTMK